MILNEILKPFLTSPEEEVQTKELTSVPEPGKDLGVFDDDARISSFFDDGSFYGIGYGTEDSYVQLQENKINQYRQISQRPEISDAIDQIVNEIIFTHVNELPLKMQIELENNRLSEAIDQCFYKISKKMKLDTRLYQLVQQGYIDGQMVFHANYDKNNIKDGIQEITMLDPRGFYYDEKKNVYRYTEQNLNNNKTTYSPEEIIRVDFGLRDGQLVLSYLEKAIKVSNMLQSLEDMLIPMRFSRSISRRVFNVDIGDLPPKRGQAVLNNYQKKFKYKKFYNTNTGEISNQQHITQMVEDYWFANRSGGKGTEVDLLDETGNLGELDDILYFNKKLYKALNIPQSRVTVGDRDSPDINFTDDGASNEDIQFYLFISRLRTVYSSLFKEILRREIISTEIMTIDEYEEYSDSIRVVFSSENILFDRLKATLFSEKINAFRDAMDYIGKTFSARTAFKKIFNMSDSEIEEEMKSIQEESKDELFKHFYAEDNW